MDDSDYHDSASDDYAGSDLLGDDSDSDTEFGLVEEAPQRQRVRDATPHPADTSWPDCFLQPQLCHSDTVCCSDRKTSMGTYGLSCNQCGFCAVTSTRGCCSNPKDNKVVNSCRSHDVSYVHRLTFSQFFTAVHLTPSNLVSHFSPTAKVSLLLSVSYPCQLAG